MDDSPNNKPYLRPYLRKNCSNGLLTLSHAISAKEIPVLVLRSSGFGQRNLLAALPYRAWIQWSATPRLYRMLGACNHPRVVHHGRQPSRRQSVPANVRRAGRAAAAKGGLT
jgi:hypothetical protein